MCVFAFYVDFFFSLGKLLNKKKVTISAYLPFCLFLSRRELDQLHNTFPTKISNLLIEDDFLEGLKVIPISRYYGLLEKNLQD